MLCYITECVISLIQQAHHNVRFSAPWLSVLPTDKYTEMYQYKDVNISHISKINKNIFAFKCKYIESLRG